MVKGINYFIIRTFIKNCENTKDPEVRKMYGVLEGWISIVGNFGLFLLKLICGLAINSVSLIADAFHTLSDVITSIVVIIGFKVSQKPSDHEHPYGHGRMEHVVTLIVSLLLIIVGIEFLKSSITRFIYPSHVQYNFIVFFLLIISSIFKEWMFRFARDLGQRIKSQALLADAWHHRSDAIATVVVGLGMIGILLGFSQIDALLGIVVSGLIIYTGYELGRECIDKLLGERPSEELLDEISCCALEVDGVKNIHDIEVHQYGETKYISAHIAVDPSISIENAHTIADAVSEKVEKKLKSPILIHLDPFKKE